MAMEFRKTATQSDFTMDSTVNLPSSSFVDLMKLKTGAQQVLFFGNGRIELGVDDRGVFKLAVNTSTPSAISGTAQLIVRDANGGQSKFITQVRSEDLANGTALGTGVRLGKSLPGAKQDSFLVIQYKADTTSTASASDTLAYVPITVRIL